MLRHTRCPCLTIRLLRTAPLAASVLLFLLILLAGAPLGVCAEAAPLPNQGYPMAVPYQPEPLGEVMLASPPALRVAPPMPAPPARRQWYGYQLMLNDAASIALLAGTAGGGATASVGALSFFFGGSVIHGVHKRAGLAVASPLMRVGFTLVGGLIGVAAENCGSKSEDFCGLGGALVGGGLGLLTAMIVDYSCAWTEGKSDAEENPVPPFAKSRSPRVSFTSAGLAPLRDGGASLVLGGRF